MQTARSDQEPVAQSTTAGQAKTAKMSALKNRSLRLYFAGQIVSMVGTWMQQMALSWLIYRLSNSPFMLGLVGFASQAPSLLLTPFAGIVADRTNRHRMILITQTLSMVQAGLLAALVFMGEPQLWQLVVLCAVLGIITAFDLPARQTFLVDMLENNEQLASAIGINSSINTLTRLIGPFVAGLFVAWAGEGLCFTVNALSYIAVIAALLFVKSKQPPITPAKHNALAQLKEGFQYTFGFAPIRELVLLIAAIGLVAMPFVVLLPAFAKDVFHGNASTLGFLTGASGAGSLVGALFLASRQETEQLGKRIIVGCALFGFGLIAFGLSTSFMVSLAVVTVIGFGSMIVMAGSNTLLQTIVDPDKRGRVMSFFLMAFMGLAPFGSMAAGSLATVIGVGATVVIAGVCTVILALLFASRVTKIHENALRLTLEKSINAADSEMTIMQS
jgi:MFS family permease